MPDSCLRLGVGIHTGNVLVGCIGSTMKMKPLSLVIVSIVDFWTMVACWSRFGCIGDAMNLASRLKGGLSSTLLDPVQAFVSTTMWT